MFSLQSSLCVQSWANTVAVETKTAKTNGLPPNYSPPQLRPLTSISTNPHLRRRKASRGDFCNGPSRTCKRAKPMADRFAIEEDEQTGRRRPRGRPPGRMRGVGRGPGRGRGQALLAPPVFDPPEFSLPSRPSSPRKRGKTITQSKADASIDSKFLESCRPSVKLMNPREARQNGPLPQVVADLYRSLTNTPGGFIPAQLKAGPPR